MPRDLGPAAAEIIGEGANVALAGLMELGIAADIVVCARLHGTDKCLVTGICDQAEISPHQKFVEALELAYQHVLSKPGGDAMDEEIIVKVEQRRAT